MNNKDEITYTIAITNDNNNLKGKISEFNENTFKYKTGKFDPITIFGDLKPIIKEDEYTFINIKEENAFGIDINIYKDKIYYEFLDTILNLLKEKSSLTINELENLKNKYNLKFEENVSYERHKKISKANLKSLASNKSINITNNDSYHCYFYECNSISDILYAVLHYLFSHNYKIVKCKHCELYFATNTLKVEYCNRISPYENLNKTCYNAKKELIRRIKRNIMRIEKRVNYRIDNYYYAEDEKYLNNFKMKCFEYEDKIEEKPTAQNFKEFEDFINENLISSKRSKKIKRS